MDRHGGHAFSHSPNRFIDGDFFRIHGVAGNNLELSLGCKVAQIRSCGSWFKVKISIFTTFVYVFTLFIGLSLIFLTMQMK